jgi:hypothetical protein
MRISTRIYAAFAFALALAACDKDNPDLPDGPPTPMADAAIDGALPPTITVRVLQEDNETTPGEPLANAEVAVVPPTGPTVVWTTDTSGTAVVGFEPGSTLWIAHLGMFPPTGGPTGHLYLFHDVAPGDTVVVGAAARPAAASTDGILSVSYNRLADPNLTYDWDHFWSPCIDYGTEVAPGQIDFLTMAGCDAPSRDLVITAFDVNFTAVAWLRVPGVAAIAGTVDGTAAAWQTVGRSYDVGITGAPADAVFARTVFASPSSWHQVETTIELTTGTTGTSTNVDLPGAALLVTKLDTQISYPTQVIAEPVPAIPTPYMIDGGELLAFPTNDGWDAATRTMRWTPSTPATSLAPQLVTASFNYYDDVSNSQYRWTIYASGSRSELVVPDVPDEMIAHDVAAGVLVYPDLWTVHVAGATYADLLTDVDLARIALTDGDASDLRYRPTTRVLAAGGYMGGGK